MRVWALALTVVIAVGAGLAACSDAPDDYCDTPGVCTLPDGAVPDVKKDATDAAPDAAPADVSTAQ